MSTNINELTGIYSKHILTWTLVAILCAALLPYSPSLSHGFVYDDDVQVLQPPAFHAWHFIPGYFISPMPGFTARYYRPLFFLWLGANRLLWGTHPLGWHLGNLILHAITSLLAFALLRKYFKDERSATIGALLFAAHPIHVETVAWISGCSDALMALGLLGSLLLWMRNCEAPSLWRRTASLVCCALALLSKETAVILPAVIFFHKLAGIPAVDSLPNQRKVQWRLALWEAAPYLAMTLICFCARLWVLRGISTSASKWISQRQALLTIPSMLWFYLGHLIWPWNLSLNYDLPVVTGLNSQLFWIPLILLAASGAATWGLLRWTGDRRILIAVLWLLVPLSPVLYVRLFAQDDFVHDRYLYLPVLGMGVLAGTLAESLTKKWKTRQHLTTAAAGIAVLSLGLVAAVQTQPWRNNLLLYTNAVRVAPNNMLARNNLAGEFVKQGRYAEAGEMFKAILEKRPGMWLPNYNYGSLNYRLGNLAVAEEYLRRAISIDPTDADEYIYLGATYLKEGRLEDADQQVRKAIARKPDGAGYHFTLGVIEWQRGNLAPAREQMLEELKYHPEASAARTQIEAIEKQIGAGARPLTP